VLKDVLGFSLDEIAADTGVSIPAVKAALHRGRAKLREATEPAHGAPSQVIARYAQLFNARDWDGVRAMLADDIQLHVVDRARKSGRGEVGQYFGNYEKLTGWRVEPCWLDGREVLAVYFDEQPRHFAEVVARGDQIATITDFFHIPYVLADARFTTPNP
jgi:RNA polymerase sigma-70 factor (ECF subfamily)